MTNTLFLIPQLSKLLLLLSFSTRKHTSTASCAILSNFFEERRTQNHPQYLSWLSRTLFPTTFLEIAVYACTCLHHSAHPPPPPPKKKKNLITITLMATNILPENLKGRNILRTLGLHCQWDTYTFFMLVLERWLYLTKPLFYGFMVGEGGAYMQRYHQLGRGGRDKQSLASYELPPTPPLIILYNTND